ncbi:MAG: hypothetical protein KA766_04125 [Piscinibacter sp.]|nr:hypothetical protein [Piscinibacter sp.]MBP5989172.1 hypothetical protein [Piscinibacter sp.]MBP6026756.1 hypothetical protein [Piscinibacter sp.]
MSLAPPAGAEPAVEGAAFTPLIKGTAAALIAGLAATGWRAADTLATAPGGSRSALLFLGLLAVLAAFCFWWILISRTRVTATHLHQTWWSDKRVVLAEVTQTKLILIPGLTWLIAPRLVVRTRSTGSVVFHAAERPVIAAFARISLGLPPLGED